MIQDDKETFLNNTCLLSVDTGGTFTDLLGFDGQTLLVHKQLSTPQTPERSIVQGIQAMGLDKKRIVRITHGSTVGTNAVLERKGVKTAYISNRGFADVLTIGRQTRSDLYSLNPKPPQPPVPAALCLETRGRVSARGERLEALRKEDLERLKKELARLKPRAVAINLLFSFMDDYFERMIAAELAEDYFVSRSSSVLPEYREYERGIATWLNSYIGPIMQDYLHRMERLLKRSAIFVMQGHGRLIPVGKASKYAVNLLLSGPAGGAKAVEAYAELYRCNKMLGLDMGGTSTDVSVIDGEALLSSEAHIGPYPVAIPMIDVHTIGAGGGSVVWLDQAKLLHVGPESAAAAPGPACYNQGGKKPTVSDANFILGRLPSELAGQLRLDRSAAVTAFTPLARALQMDLEEVAMGAVKIVNEQMQQALNVMSVYKGYDPSDFVLAGFGAAAGLHICALADGLTIQRSIMPAHAGVLSALGIWVAGDGVQKTLSVCKPLNKIKQDELDGLRQRLSAQALEETRLHRMTISRTEEHIALRYLGQSSCLTLPWCPLAQLEERFNIAYEKRHGYQLNTVVELAAIRIQAWAPSRLNLRDVLSRNGREIHYHYSTERASDVLHALPVGARLEGPAVLISPINTSYLPAGWQVHCDSWHTLHFSRSGS